ncbi:MAG: flagellar biosynthetic protein FliO [bacterium]
MAKNNRPTRRSLWLVAMVSVAVVAVLVAICVDQVAADRDVSVIPPPSTSNAETNQMAEEFSSSALPSLMRMAGALLVVVICIYAGLYLMKRLVMKRSSSTGRGRLLQVIETTGVAPKKTLSLIRVADKAVLIGMTDSHMSVLTELDAEQTAQIMAAPDTCQETDNFARLLKSVSRRFREVGVRKDRAALET